MGNLLAYSGIITKVKAMGSRLLNAAQYQQIAQLETTTDFMAYLKQQAGYKELLANLDESSLHRGQIEPILSNSLFLDYGNIYQFATKEQRDVLYFVFFRYEVNILKTCLQRVFNNKTNVDLSLFAPFFNQHSKLDVTELSSAATMDDFVRKLNNTEYYKLFYKLQNEGIHTLYDFETQLDIYYFQKIWRMKNKLLKGQTLKSISEIFGTQIDLLNIMWIYRSKKFYDIDTGKIYATIIPCNYKLKKEQLTKLIEASNINDFITILESTYYQHISKNINPADIEDAYHMLIYKIYHKTKQENPNSMVPILGFLHEKEQEIERLTTALECIRYKLPAGDILAYMKAV